MDFPGKRFEDDVVIVTGSTRGIGEAIARRFAAEGAAVVVSGRTTERGESVVEDIRANGGNAVFVETDVREMEDVASLIEASVGEYDGIDVVVNNAAVQTKTSVQSATVRDWDRVLETDFRAYWLCAKHAAAHMTRGSIINISSNHAFATMPEHFPYNAVKAGINGMTRSFALDLGPKIRVNTINPGWIGVDRTLEALTTDELQRLESIHPVGRIGEPDDVAGVAAFLASDDAAFVTGATLLVDGGRGAVMQDDVLPDYRDAAE